MRSKHPQTFEKNNPREVFGWKMYDWANSAFSTTIVGALFGPYLTEITQRAVGENGVVVRPWRAWGDHFEVVLSYLRIYRRVSANISSACPRQHR